MKRFFYALLITAAFGTALTSCNNGDYDANPDANYGTIKNPIYNPGGGNGGGVTKGTIKCKLNGTQVTFNNAVFMELIGRNVFGGAQDGGKGKIITLSLANYSGVKTYPIDAQTGCDYSVTNMSTASVESSHSTDPATPAGGEIVVTSDANDEMKGTFHFTMFMTLPNPSTTDKIEVTDGSFYVGKQ